MDVLLFSDGVSAGGRGRAQAPRPRAGAGWSWGRAPGTAIIDGVRARLRQRGPRGLGGRGRGGRHRALRRSRCCVDRAGAGISRCYGTGGRDLKERGGRDHGARRHRAPRADDETDVILCVSKPPSPDVAERVLGALAATRRPAAACMVGGGVEPVAGVHLAADAGGGRPRRRPPRRPPRPSAPGPPRAEWVTGGAVRGLFSGRHALQRGRRDPGRAPRRRVHQRPGGRARRLEGDAARARVPGPGRGGVHPRPAPPDDRPRGPRRAPGRRRRPIPRWACC